MNQSSIHTCPYCNKEFSKAYNLALHIKTAKYCLELRQETVNTTYTHTCDGCLKEFSLKQSYEKHILTCKEYYAHIKVNEIKTEYEAKLSVLEEKCRLLESTHESKNIIINNNVVNFNNITNYNAQFNTLLQDITPFTDKNIKNGVEQIRYTSLLNLNDSNVNNNFIAHFVNAVKDMTFSTDSSRNKLVVKREDNKPEKVTGESFIIECLSKSEHEIMRLIQQGINYCRDDNNTSMTDDYKGECIVGLATLSNLIKQKGANRIVRSLSSNLSKTCKQISKKHLN